MLPKKALAKTDSNKVIEEDDEDSESVENERDIKLRNQFALFVKIGENPDPGTHILLSQSDVWMRQANVISGRKLTSTDTGICFFKFRKYKLNYHEYLEFLKILADYKNISVDEIIDKLIESGPPPKQAPKLP